MAKKLSFSLFIVSLILLTNCRSGLESAKIKHTFEHFITVKGDKIYEGGNEFRFITFNIPNLHINEDPLPDGWHRNEQWEIEDAFRSISQIGGRVIRMYVPSIRGGIRPGFDKMAHIYAPGVYDEDLFKDLDLVLKTANDFGIRVIIPFVDNNQYFGGNLQFAAFYNTENETKTRDDFYNDPEIVAGFKDLITFMLERENTYTGIRYKDDKAIMAWETGNEIGPPAHWTAEIAAHIKSIAPKQLVMDGNFYVQESSLDIPHVDIISAHYYWGKELLLDSLRADIDLINGRKPFIVGEIPVRDTVELVQIFDTIIQNNISGIGVWSLRFRDIKGGFYFHYEGGPAPMGGLVYRWPGFPNGDVVNERGVFKVMRRKAHEIQGVPMPKLPIPEPPYVFDITADGRIGWRGQTGSAYFILEKAEKKNGPWIVAEEELYDDACPFEPFQFTQKHEQRVLLQDKSSK
jgi:hypothetical protein